MSRDLVDGGVGAEVGDPPAAVGEHEAEADEAERVALARRAGEQRQRPGAGLPALRHREQPALDEVAGEVLVADGELAALPAPADLAEQGQDDVADAGHGAAREGGVEQGVEARGVERLGGGDERLEQRPRVGGRDDLARRLGDRECGGLRGREAAGHVGLHRADAALVGRRVQAVAAGAALRLQEPVPALPRAQRLLLHADESRRTP